MLIEERLTQLRQLRADDQDRALAFQTLQKDEQNERQRRRWAALQNLHERYVEHRSAEIAYLERMQGV